MLTKKQILDSIETEINIIKHLASKVDPSNEDYRPSAKMRSTIELLRYLTACGIVATTCNNMGTWEPAGPMLKKSTELRLKDIPAALDAQMQGIRDVVDEIPDEELMNRDISYPWGGQDKLGSGLVNTTLRFLTAYRMQLFLYLKMSSHPDISTFNCWGGVDGPM